MPKRRKGTPPFPPLIPILLQAACVTEYDLKQEPDSRKRKQLKLERDRADAELFRIYRRAKAAGQLDKLPPRVRRHCEELLRYGPARARKAMRARVGRPSQAGEHLAIAVQVADKLDELGRKRGSIGQAIEVVAARIARDCETVREIYYAFHNTDELEAERARRRHAAWQLANPEEAAREFEAVSGYPLSKSAR